REPRIAVVREAALHGRLEGKRPPCHVPGSVVLLPLQQEAQPTLPRRVAHGILYGLRERVEDLSRRVGVAFERRQLSPATILPLPLPERLGQAGQLRRRLARPVQTEQLKDRFLVRFRLDLPQPSTGALDTGRKLLLAARPAVMLDRLNRQRRCTDVARCDRRP